MSAVTQYDIDGRLRFQGTQIGGGFSVGESYISLTNAGHAGIAAGDSYQVPWTLSSSAGSDLALNVDPSVVDVLTTGWYSVTAGCELDGAMTEGQLAMNMAFLTPVAAAGFTSGDYEQFWLSSGPVAFTSGDAVHATVFADNAGSMGTYDLQSAQLVIVRLS